MVPLNLMKNKAADYILTGQWAKRHIRKAPFTERPMPLRPALTRPSAIFRTAPTCLFPRTRTMCISVRTTPFTGPSSGPCPIPREDPGGGPVLLLPVRARGCDKVRPDLCRCPEERGTGGNRHCHCEGGPGDRGCAARDTLPCSATRPMRTLSPCTIHRLHTAYTCAERYLSG